MFLHIGHSETEGKTIWLDFEDAQQANGFAKSVGGSLLNVIGKTPQQKERRVLIVGARICSEYGRYMARVYGQAFGAAGWQVVTDMALGVGGIAAKAALDAGARVFAVMGCGADVCYPPENRDLYERIKKHGGVISAYPSGTQPKREFFDERRKILAALADVVVVIESRKHGGDLVTAELARAAGAEVYACPGRCTDRLSDGTNAMIMKHEAKITTTPEDVIQAHNELPFN